MKASEGRRRRRGAAEKPRAEEEDGQRKRKTVVSRKTEIGKIQSWQLPKFGSRKNRVCNEGSNERRHSRQVSRDTDDLVRKAGREAR